MIEYKDGTITYKGDEAEIIAESFAILTLVLKKLKEKYGVETTMDIMNELFQNTYEDVFEVSLVDYYMLKHLPEEDILH